MKVIVTASDVIHSWGVPAFWVKIDAVPGRLNETWFKADKPGVYYGQCFELCGARHAYMPIAVEVAAAGAVRRLGRLEGRHHAGREPAQGARFHRRLAGHQPAGRADRRRRRDRNQPGADRLIARHRHPARVEPGRHQYQARKLT